MPAMTRQQLAEHLGHLISQDRNATHGDPQQQFQVAQRLKTAVRDAILDNSSCIITDVGEEAIDMICTKISCLACGSNLQNHWLDIAGYALIAAEGAEKALQAKEPPATPARRPRR